LDGTSGSQDLYPLAEPFGVLKLYLPKNLTVYEDVPYTEYWHGRNSPYAITWVVDTNADWLSFSKGARLTMTGTPDQSDVGTCFVDVKVSDKYVSRQANLTIEVLNVNDAPVITTQDLLFCDDGDDYCVDYEACDEDPGDEGSLVWSLETNASFLTLATGTGILSGKPLIEDSGRYWVRVGVSDGNGGDDYHNFTLTVNHDNLPPTITTEDVSVTHEEDMYYVDYEAYDLETGDEDGEVNMDEPQGDSASPDHGADEPHPPSWSLCFCGPNPRWSLCLCGPNPRWS